MGPVLSYPHGMHFAEAITNSLIGNSLCKAGRRAVRAARLKAELSINTLKGVSMKKLISMLIAGLFATTAFAATHTAAPGADGKTTTMTKEEKANAKADKDAAKADEKAAKAEAKADKEKAKADAKMTKKKAEAKADKTAAAAEAKSDKAEARKDRIEDQK